MVVAQPVGLVLEVGKLAEKPVESILVAEGAGEVEEKLCRLVELMRLIVQSLLGLRRFRKIEHLET